MKRRPFTSCAPHHFVFLKRQPGAQQICAEVSRRAALAFLACLLAAGPTAYAAKASNARGAQKKPTTPAARTPASTATQAQKEGWVKTVASEVALVKPAHDKNEADPGPLRALDARAYPAAEALGQALASEYQISRNDALYAVRVVVDLVSVDPSAAAADIFASLRHKTAMVALLSECRGSTAPARANAPAPTNASPALAHQEGLQSAGISLVNQRELCDFKGMMQDLDRLERDGNG